MNKNKNVILLLLSLGNWQSTFGMSEVRKGFDNKQDVLNELKQKYAEKKQTRQDVTKSSDPAQNSASAKEYPPTTTTTAQLAITKNGDYPSFTNFFNIPPTTTVEKKDEFFDKAMKLLRKSYEPAKTLEKGKLKRDHAIELFEKSYSTYENDKTVAALYLIYYFFHMPNVKCPDNLFLAGFIYKMGPQKIKLYPEIKRTLEDLAKSINKSDAKT